MIYLFRESHTDSNTINRETPGGLLPATVQTTTNPEECTEAAPDPQTEELVTLPKSPPIQESLQGMLSTSVSSNSFTDHVSSP